MTKIHEIAPDVFRLSIYVPEFDMQFNHFLVRDEAPLLFHAGLKGMFFGPEGGGGDADRSTGAANGSSYSGAGDRLLVDLAE